MQLEYILVDLCYPDKVFYRFDVEHDRRRYKIEVVEEDAEAKIISGVPFLDVERRSQLKDLIFNWIEENRA